MTYTPDAYREELAQREFESAHADKKAEWLERYCRRLLDEPASLQWLIEGYQPEIWTDLALVLRLRNCSSAPLVEELRAALNRVHEKLLSAMERTQQ